MFNTKNLVASANNTAFIVCLSVVVALIFIAVVCLLWWTEIKQRSVKELFEKFRECVRNFGNTISSNKPVKTVYSDKSKNFSGTEFLPEPAKAPTKEYTYEFMGWNKNYVDKEGNTIAKPVFIRRVNTYRVNVYGTDNSTIIRSEIVEYGAGIDLSDISLSKAETKEFSYEFECWDKDTKTIYKNENIYPVFKAIPKKFTYTFYDADEKTILSQMTAIYGTPILKPKQPKSEDSSLAFSHFKGYEEGMLLTRDISFVAVYKKNTSVKLTVTIADEALKKQSASSYGYDREEQIRAKQKTNKQSIQSNDAFFKNPFKVFGSKDTDSKNIIDTIDTDKK